MILQTVLVLVKKKSSPKAFSQLLRKHNANIVPMTALGSVPKAQTHGEPEGTWNLEKLHLELKYFGRKLAEAKLREK